MNILLSLCFCLFDNFIKILLIFYFFLLLKLMKLLFNCLKLFFNFSFFLFLFSQLIFVFHKFFLQRVNLCSIIIKLFINLIFFFGIRFKKLLDLIKFNLILKNSHFHSLIFIRKLNVFISQMLLLFILENECLLKLVIFLFKLFVLKNELFVHGQILFLFFLLLLIKKRIRVLLLL